MWPYQLVVVIVVVPSKDEINLVDTLGQTDVVGSSHVRQGDHVVTTLQSMELKENKYLKLLISASK